MRHTLDEGLRQFATEKQWEKLKAYAEHGTDAAAAEALGLNKGAVYTARHAVMAKAVRQGYSPQHDLVHPLPDGLRLKGESTLYDMQTGQAKIQWRKSEVDKERQLEIMKEMADNMAADLPRLPPRTSSPQNVQKHLMMVIPLGDPHFGLFAWAKESGDDFDLEVARSDLCAAIAYLIESGPPTPRCLIANLGDFFHVDNMKGQTTKGTPQDTAGSLPEMIGVGVSALRQSIETALEKHEIVEVINALGNHDQALALALSIMLANIYENEPRVIIHDDPTPRHYVQHGKVLIGVTHGKYTKDRDLPGIMATEKPVMWGETKHRYFYRGHEHHDERMEYNGCMVEQFRTLAPNDTYNNKHGWLSGRDMKAILHHSEYGEVGRSTCSIDMLRNAAG